MQRFATIEINGEVFLGVLEITSGKAGRPLRPFFYWHFKTPDYLGSSCEGFSISSNYKYIKTERDLKNSLSRFGIVTKALSKKEDQS